MKILLEVCNLSKSFCSHSGLFHWKQIMQAVKSISFTLQKQQTLAVIGKNGSGKSTLAKMLAGMIEPSTGEILIERH